MRVFDSATRETLPFVYNVDIVFPRLVYDVLGPFKSVGRLGVCFNRSFAMLMGTPNAMPQGKLDVLCPFSIIVVRMVRTWAGVTGTRHGGDL